MPNYTLEFDLMFGNYMYYRSNIFLGMLYNHSIYNIKSLARDVSSFSAKKFGGAKKSHDDALCPVRKNLAWS